MRRAREHIMLSPPPRLVDGVMQQLELEWEKVGSRRQRSF
jgi:hypothetical protein